MLIAETSLMIIKSLGSLKIDLLHEIFRLGSLGLSLTSSTLISFELPSSSSLQEGRSGLSPLLMDWGQKDRDKDRSGIRENLEKDGPSPGRGGRGGRGRGSGIELFRWLRELEGDMLSVSLEWFIDLDRYMTTVCQLRWTWRWYSSRESSSDEYSFVKWIHCLVIIHVLLWIAPNQFLCWALHALLKIVSWSICRSGGVIALLTNCFSTFSKKAG